MALIRAQQIQRSVTVREHDDRGVGQSDVEIGIAFHGSPCKADVLGREQFELIRAARDFVDERHLRLVTDPVADEIIQLREHKG